MNDRSVKKPTHRLAVRERMPDGSMGRAKGYIGKGWLNPNGSVTIHLNPGTALLWSDKLAIGLFPINDTGRIPDDIDE